MSDSALIQVALIGNPNCGKTSIFNAMTGSRQRVGNYAGVTVDKREGRFENFTLIDLPGTYSLQPKTLDEEVARDVILGKIPGEFLPDTLVVVLDATQLERTLALALEVRETIQRSNSGQKLIAAVNMMDLAHKRGQELDLSALAKELGFPVVSTVGIWASGVLGLKDAIRKNAVKLAPGKPADSVAISGISDVQARYAEVDRILSVCVKRRLGPTRWTDRIDRFVLHPIFGNLFLLAVLTLVFQSIFNWATVPQDWIESGIGMLSAWVSRTLGPGLFTQLLTDGILAGVGSVVVFLPQILLLFFFILILEDSGYMARAAFLMDRMMGRVGLHGRAFIPLISSFACAIPGIMATRTIENRRDRLTTILIAPLMTCSARLPVYSLIIAAFIPNTEVFGPFKLQGLVMLGLYGLGVFGALVVAYILKKTVLKQSRPPLILEMPTYKWPGLISLVLGLWDRAKSFLTRAGTVILGLMMALWLLSNFPKPPAEWENLPVATREPAISYSVAGRIGHFIEPVFRPLGFDWKISVALIPGFAAREVMVGALATVYAVESSGGQAAAIEPDRESKLTRQLSQAWSLPTALSLLVWYVFAMQCASTLAVTRRETQSWKWPAVQLGYMTVLAYVFSALTFWITQ
ncbi:MAG: ferrous iron transport protein B [Bdellovibrionales bacterium]|nr:ferrous iron transport protein B [Bdellovibrionales bacterium]